MPKKKNAFWTFLLEYKREHKIESQQEAMQKADAVWKNMSQTERKRYAPRKETIRLGCAPLREIEVKHNEETLFQQTMVEEITSELAMAKKYNNLSTYRFFIIHVNSFCCHTETKKHYPCEIGISSFTLKDGVSANDVYHAMIFPGPLPNGYSAQARLISETTHQIPWEFGDVNNTEKIFDEVIDFLMQRSRVSSKLPILYTRKKEMDIVKNVLDLWCDEYDPSMNFTVYSVQTLFSLLHRSCIPNEPWSSESLSFIEIERDIHSFASGITCEYHESADVQVYCARSIAIRIGYVICQNCCKGLDIDLVPGQHIPLEMKVQNAGKNSFSSKMKNKQLLEESTSSVRLDSSDEDTMSSFGRSSMYEEDSPSSINFPEYDNSSVTSESTVVSKKFSNHHSGSGNLSNEYASRTGSSGFSRKPAVLPSTVNDNFGKLTLSQESVEKRPGVLPSMRGRGGAVPKGKGRGHPFRK